MLTDTAIRKAKPAASPLKLTDGGGMYLLLKPDGGKYWRMNYRYEGKQKTLALQAPASPAGAMFAKLAQAGET